MICSLVNRKGGVGKSTLAINLSASISQGRKNKVLLVDSDPQASVMHWAAVRDTHSFDVAHHPKADLHRQIKPLSAGYTHVIVDAPPGIGDISLSILLASNIAIIPVNPSPVDLWSTSEMVELVREGKKHNKQLKAFLLIAKKQAGTILGSQVREALSGYRLPVLKTEIGLRADYAKALLDGQAVTEFAPRSPAAQEIKKLTNEVLRK